MARLRKLLLLAPIVLISSNARAEETRDAAPLTVRSTPARVETDIWMHGERLVLKIPKPSHERWAAVIDAAAKKEGLPAVFLEKLLARESEFFPFAVSSAGAEGIAQFMPRTASGRSLDDPFDASQAIPAAASYVAELRKRFGNLGLAAAAYNAGPRRVSDWLAGTGGLPAETAAYVRAITGKDAIDWLAPEQRAVVTARSFGSAIGTTSFTFPSTSTAKRGRAPKLSPEATLCAGLASAGQPCIVKEAY